MIEFEQLAVILRKNGAVKDGDILPTDRLQEDLLLNSLGLLMLIVNLENTLGTSLDLNQFTDVKTAGELLELLRKED